MFELYSVQMWNLRSGLEGGKGWVGGQMQASRTFPLDWPAQLGMAMFHAFSLKDFLRQIAYYGILERFSLECPK